MMTQELQRPRLWLTLSAMSVTLGALLAAVRRRRARAPSVGGMSEDWLRDYSYTSGQRDEA